jgi:hypothetical protein
MSPSNAIQSQCAGLHSRTSLATNFGRHMTTLSSPPRVCSGKIRVKHGRTTFFGNFHVRERTLRGTCDATATNKPLSGLREGSCRSTNLGTFRDGAADDTTIPRLRQGLREGAIVSTSRCPIPISALSVRFRYLHVLPPVRRSREGIPRGCRIPSLLRGGQTGRLPLRHLRSC